MWDWNCEVAMCVCRVHIKIDSDFKCTFTILVPIWLQGMALTAVQGIMGKNVNDDWGEKASYESGSWVLSGQSWRHPAPWHGGHGGGQLMVMGQYWLWWWGRLRMTRHVTRSHRDTSQRYREERTDPGTIERPEVTRNIKQMYSQFTVTASAKIWEK